MRTKFVLSSVALLAMSCATLDKPRANPIPELGAVEIDTVKGQWDYDLLTNDGTKIKGFFQVEPTSHDRLNVAGQAYYDNGSPTLFTDNLRGVWNGVLSKDAEHHRYVLDFSMKSNALSKNPSEIPYRGTIFCA